MKFYDEGRDLLISFPLLESWNGLVLVMSNSISGSRTLKFDYGIGVILSEEMRWKRTCETSGNALTIETRGRQRERGKSLGNHGKSRKGRSKSRARVECWNSGKKGNLKKYCQSRK